MALHKTTSSLIARINARAKDLQPDSLKLKAALDRIGLNVTAKAKFNARRQGIVDTGRLINSLRYEYFRDGDVAGIRLGSFGVPYAALHEFGGPFTDRMRRAMFASIRKRGGPERPNKGVIQGKRFRARPYLRPAVLESRNLIMNILREVAGGE